MDKKVFTHGNYTVRHWTQDDRESIAEVVRLCLESYGLTFEAQGADLDAIDVEDHYLKDERGEFWVVVDDQTKKVVGSGGYYQVDHDSDRSGRERGQPHAVEIRKMYLLPEARGKRLGRTLLEQLERRISERGVSTVYVETATVLKEACKLYATAGYTPVEGVETRRCDQRLVKQLTS